MLITHLISLLEPALQYLLKLEVFIPLVVDLVYHLYDLDNLTSGVLFGLALSNRHLHLRRRTTSLQQLSNVLGLLL